MHYEIRIKCLSCSLHFIVLTWNPGWNERDEIHCPECGETTTKLVSDPIENESEIYTKVPGDTMNLALRP